MKCHTRRPATIWKRWQLRGTPRTRNMFTANTDTASPHFPSTNATPNIQCPSRALDPGVCTYSTVTHLLDKRYNTTTLRFLERAPAIQQSHYIHKHRLRQRRCLHLLTILSRYFEGPIRATQMVQLLPPETPRRRRQSEQQGVPRRSRFVFLDKTEPSCLHIDTLPGDTNRRHRARQGISAEIVLPSMRLGDNAGKSQNWEWDSDAAPKFEKIKNNVSRDFDMG